MLKAKHRRDLDGVHIRVGMLFSKFGISANAWTVLSIAPALVGLLFLAKGMLLPGLAAFFVSAFIDIIDGNVARVTKSVSSLGAFMDGVVDRYVEFLLYVGLWFYMGPVTDFLISNGLWIVFLVFSAVMPSFITAYADHRGVISDSEKLKNMGGVLERFERLGIIYLGMAVAYIYPQALVYSIITVIILSNVTAIQRLIYVVKNS